MPFILAFTLNEGFAQVNILAVGILYPMSLFHNSFHFSLLLSFQLKTTVFYTFNHKVLQSTPLTQLLQPKSILSYTLIQRLPKI